MACGLHAGDPVVMLNTVRLAAKNGVSVGAHPGYPDMQGFGRRAMDLTPAEVEAFMTYQLGALWAFCQSEGLPLQHVKPHGALYNAAATDPNLAAAVARAVARVDRQLILVGLAGSELLRAGERTGLRVASEVLADRAYNPDGTLVPRRREGAVVRDPELVARRVLTMLLEGRVQACDDAHTVCFHSDTPGAANLVRAVRARLAEAGVAVIPMGRWLR